MDNFTPFEKSAFPGGLALRWMNANCYEIKLPNGKTILSDPFLPEDTTEVPLWKRFACGITAKDLEGADYALISHPHGDHMCNVPEVFDRFGTKILAHQACAILFTTKLMIPQQFVFPIDNNQHYEFDDFTLDTSLGRHVYNDVIDPNDGRVRRLSEINVPGLNTIFEEFDILGGMFNTDYVITTKNNFRIGFCTGTFDDFARNALKGKGINLLMRQIGWEMHIDAYQKVAEELMVTGAELMLPLHHEREYGHMDMVAFSQRVNDYLAEQKYPGRLFIPERAVWYKVGASIAKRD